MNFGTRKWQTIFRAYRKGTGDHRKTALCSLRRRIDQALQKTSQTGSALYLHRPDGPDGKRRGDGKHRPNGSPRPDGPGRKHRADRSPRPDGPDGKHRADRSPRPHRSNGKHGLDRKHRPNGSPRPDGSYRKHRPGRNGSGGGISVRLFRAGFSREFRDAAGFRPERRVCGNGSLPCGKKRKLSSE